MEKVSSYYDWQQEFKKPSKSRKPHSLKKKKNSIGLSEGFFRDYISKWKKKYLE
jgi:hypothetical protein